jgi:hypothetical protein
VAVDVTGLAEAADITCFVKRRHHHHLQKSPPWRNSSRWLVVVDAVETAAEQTRIGLVLADAEFDSERDHSYIR